MGFDQEKTVPLGHLSVVQQPVGNSRRAQNNRYIYLLYIDLRGLSIEIQIFDIDFGISIVDSLLN